jgi:group I intron endonuclease
MTDDIDVTQFNVPCDQNWLEGGTEPTFGSTEDPTSGLWSGIYWIYCLANDKVYIGSAVDFRRRWAIHVTKLRRGRHHSPYLQNSWDKYGPGAFAFEVLEFIELSRLVQMEQIYLDAFQAYDRECGFNVCVVAGSVLGRISAHRGRKQSEEHIRKRSEAKRGKKHSDEAKQRMSESHRGKTISEETRQKMSESQRGRVMSEESCEKIRETLLGHVVSDETRRKIGEANRGRACREEVRRKISDAIRGRVVSEESRQKMREARIGRKGVMCSEEAKRKIGEALRGRKKSEETKQKMREAYARRKEMQSDKSILFVEE